MNSKAIISVAALAAGIVIAITACSDSSKNSSSNQTISNPPILIEPGVRVGKVRAGMTVEEVIANLGKPDRDQGGALNYERLGLAVCYGKDRGVFAIVCGGFSGINGPYTKAFTGRTKDGIGMGSSRADVIKVYGKPSDSVKGPTGEGLRYRSVGLTFALQEGRVCHMIVDFQVSK